MLFYTRNVKFTLSRYKGNYSIYIYIGTMVYTKYVTDKLQ